MKLSIVTLLAVLALIVLLSGCTTTTSVMPMSGGIYTVTRTGQNGFYALGTLRKKAYQEVNEFADIKGKVAEIISVNEVPTGFARFPQVEVRFRLVTAAEQAEHEKQPTIQENATASYDAMGRPNDADRRTVIAKDADIYEELKKLGELKKNGFLTDAEFQQEKKRILDRGKE